MATIALPRQPVASLHRNPASVWRHIDFVLIGCVGAVASLGLVMVFSATRGAEEPFDYSFVKKQVMFVVLGLVAMAVTALFDYRRLRDYALFIYGGSLVLLVAVLVLGEKRKGTQGWFQLGPFQLQPSEFAKIGLIIGVAYLAAQFRNEVDGRRFVTLIMLCAVPMVLVMLQPDLGTTIVSAAVTIALLVVAGARGRHLVLLGLVAVFAIGLILQSGRLDTYQTDRLATFLEQDNSQLAERTSRTAAYNLNQSKIAIGSGGVWGKGLFDGNLTRLQYVPEQHTDFIFTAVGEELGLLGAGGLLGVFSVIVWRIWRAAKLAGDEFGSLLCIGVLAMLVFQTFQNVGMTMGIMPITGIPLPFMSYGGSSIVTSFMAMGLVLNVHMRRFS
jgi:rod shape determining protein RodA